MTLRSLALGELMTLALLMANADQATVMETGAFDVQDGGMTGAVTGCAEGSRLVATCPRSLT